jgi:acetolactate synthase-1/2/3 large subunit
MTVMARTATEIAPASETPNARTAESLLVPEKISGGHLVAKAHKAEGVDTIFTLCGGHIIDSYDGCVDEGIQVVDVRHEQVAAHTADGHARETGRPGRAVVTAGPVATDAVTGVANAVRAESPMLPIGGQGALNQPRMGSLLMRRARESGKPSLINVSVDPDAYAPGNLNQTTYKQSSLSRSW